MTWQDEQPLLPEGWTWATIGDVAEIVMGQSPPGHTYNSVGDGLPFFQGKAEFGESHPEVRKWTTAAHVKVAEAGDILVSVRAPVGPTNLADRRSGIGRGLAAVRPACDVSRDYLHWAIRACEHELIAKSQGSTFQSVSKAVLGAQVFPIAPPEEQRRIVEQLNEQMSLLDAATLGVESLGRKTGALHSSLRRAAVVGALQSREPAGAPSRQVVLDARSERAARPPPQDVPPAPCPVPVPDGWNLVSLSDVAWDIDYGTSTRCDYDGLGMPVLRIPNVQAGRIDTSDLKRAVDTTLDLSGSAVTPGDILVVRTNGSKDLIGRCGQVETDAELAFASYLIRFAC